MTTCERFVDWCEQLIDGVPLNVFEGVEEYSSYHYLFHPVLTLKNVSFGFVRRVMK